MFEHGFSLLFAGSTATPTFFVDKSFITLHHLSQDRTEMTEGCHRLPPRPRALPGRLVLGPRAVRTSWTGCPTHPSGFSARSEAKSPFPPDPSTLWTP